jgi:hypothetical protein
VCHKEKRKFVVTFHIKTKFTIIQIDIWHMRFTSYTTYYNIILVNKNFDDDDNYNNLILSEIEDLHLLLMLAFYLYF